MVHCILPGSLTEWTPWSACSVTCGVGVQNRNRTCENGTGCPGLLHETNQCFGAAITCAGIYIVFVYLNIHSKLYTIYLVFF